MSGLLIETRSRLAGRALARKLADAFERTPAVRTGTYLGSNQVQVAGQTYPFRNESGVTVEAGESLEVVNVGRRAAAEYAPAAGAGSYRSTSGSGTSSGTNATTIQDRAVSANAPADGVALVWDASASQWQPKDFYVRLAGDTMAGLLILSGDPAADLGAATKQYVDSLYTTILPYVVVDDGAVVVDEGEIVWSA